MKSVSLLVFSIFFVASSWGQPIYSEAGTIVSELSGLETLDEINSKVLGHFSSGEIAGIASFYSLNDYSLVDSLTKKFGLKGALTLADTVWIMHTYASNLVNIQTFSPVLLLDPVPLTSPPMLLEPESPLIDLEPENDLYRGLYGLVGVAGATVFFILAADSGETMQSKTVFLSLAGGSLMLAPLVDVFYGLRTSMRQQDSHKNSRSLESQSSSTSLRQSIFFTEKMLFESIQFDRKDAEESLKAVAKNVTEISRIDADFLRLFSRRAERSRSWAEGALDLAQRFSIEVNRYVEVRQEAMEKLELLAGALRLYKTQFSDEAASVEFDSTLTKIDVERRKYHALLESGFVYSVATTHIIIRKLISDAKAFN